MAYRTRIEYMAAQKSEMWDRWQKGDSLASMARLFDRGHSSVQGILQWSGGIRPPQRTRSRFALTFREREEISRGIVAGHSIRSIAITLGRAASTFSREISRNSGRQYYRASGADQAAWITLSSLLGGNGSEMIGEGSSPVPLQSRCNDKIRNPSGCFQVG